MKPHPILADIGKLVHCIHPALKGICRAHEDHEGFGSSLLDSLTLVGGMDAASHVLIS